MREDDRLAARFEQPDERGLDEINRAAFAELLGTKNPRYVFEMLMTPGRPTDITRSVAYHQRRRAYLLDDDELLRRSASYIGLHAEEYDPQAELGPWLFHKVDLAMDAMRREDERDYREKLKVEEPYEPRFDLLVARLGVPRRHLRLVCITINDLPSIERLAFKELILEHQNMNAFFRRERVDPHLTRKGLRVNLKAIGAIWRYEQDIPDDAE